MTPQEFVAHMSEVWARDDETERNAKVWATRLGLSRVGERVLYGSHGDKGYLWQCPNGQYVFINTAGDMVTEV